MFRDIAWRGLTALLACLTYFHTTGSVRADPPHTQWKNLTILETPGEGTGFSTYDPNTTPQSYQCRRGRLAFSPDGKFLNWPWHEPNNDNFGVPKRQLFRLHDLRTGTTTSVPIPQEQGDFPGALGIRFTEDSRHFLASGMRSLQLWDVGQKTWVRSLPKGEGSYAYPVHSLAVTSQAVFTKKTSKASEVIRWSLADGTLQVVPKLGGGFALAPDGQRQADYGLDFEKFDDIPYVEFLDAAGNKQRVAWGAKDHGRPRCGVFSPDGRLFAAGGNLLEPKGEGFDVRWAVRVLDAATLKVRWEVRNLEPPAASFDWCQSGLFSRDGRYFALENKGELVVYETDQGQEVARLPRPLRYGADPKKDPENRTALWDFAFAPDSSAVATAWDDGTVRLWGVVGKPAPMEPRPAIIVIPGIMGSTLKDGETFVWPRSRFEVGWRYFLRLLDLDALRADAQGNPLRPLLADELQENYTPLVEHLKSLGYLKDEGLYLFPYDWRKDNREHLKDDNPRGLPALIQRARNGGRRKVVLIGHSMGGLLARAYAIQHPDHVAKIITVGTPYHGSVESFYSLAEGDLERICGVHTFDRFRDVVFNYPSIYQLLPDRDFLRDENDRTLPLNLMRQLRLPGHPVGGRRVSLPPSMLAAADDFRSKYGPQVPLPGVRTFTIIGCGLPTLDGLALLPAPLPDLHRQDDLPAPLPNPNQFDDELVQLGNRFLRVSLRFGNGDGTVPLWGALLDGAFRYLIPEGSEGSSLHRDLPGNRRALTIITSLLASQPLPPTPRERLPGLNFTLFRLNSDAVLSVQDGQGRAVGLTAANEAKNDHPAGRFYRIAGGEYVVVNGLDQKARVVVTGIRSGKFTLGVHIFRNDKMEREFVYRKVTVSKGTVAEVSFVPSQIAGSAPDLSVTHDGQTRKIAASIATTPPPKDRPAGKESPPASPDATKDKGTPSTREDDWHWLAGGAGAGVLTLGVVAGCLFLLSRRGPTAPAVRPPGSAPGRKSVKTPAPQFAITCPVCQARIKVSVKLCGRAARCPNCKRTIGIPNLPNKPTGRG